MKAFHEYRSTAWETKELNRILKLFRENMNEMGRDIESCLYPYSEHYFVVDIETDDGYDIKLEGEFDMIFPCLEALSQSEPNR